MKKVSVVIIAYNIENYIDKCLNSIIKQTYDNLEIIVVNDGSKDKTLEKIEEKMKLDPRIVLINQENKGAIEARKSGYKKITGDYVLFVDGDDWIDITAIEKLVYKAEISNADLVYYEYLEIFEGKEPLPKVKSKTSEYLEGTEFLKNILLGDILPTMCGKFFKVKFLEEYKIEFPKDISYAEDLAFVASVGCNNPKAAYLNEYLYMYYQREGSTTRKISSKLLEINTAMEFIKNKLKEKGLYEEFREEFEYTAYMHCIASKKQVIFNKNNPYGKEMFNRWKSFNISIKDNRYISSKMEKASTIGRILTILGSKYYFIGSIINR